MRLTLLFILAATTLFAQDAMLDRSSDFSFPNAYSLSFNGVDESVSRNTYAAIEFEGDDDFTVSLWCKFSTVASGNTIFCNKTGWHDVGWQLGRTGKKLYFIMQNEHANHAQYVFSEDILTADAWYHITWVRDGANASNIRLYVNGNVQFLNVFTNNYLTSDATDYTTLGIGKLIGSSGNFFSGMIYHPAIFNKALSTVEVKELLNHKNHDYRELSFAPNLVGAWAMPQGDIAYPTYTEYVNGQNGTMTNMETDDVRFETPDFPLSNFPLSDEPTGSIAMGAVNEYINFGDHDDFSFTNGSGTDLPFTFFIWMNRANTNLHSVMSKTCSSTEYILRLNGTSLQMMILSAVGHYIGRSAPMSTTNSWIGIAVTYDGSKSAAGVKLYSVSTSGTVTRIDNANFNNNAFTAMPNSICHFIIGSYHGGASHHFEGKIASPVLANVVLDTTQIGQLAAIDDGDYSGLSFYDDIVSAWYFPNGQNDFPLFIDSKSGHNGILTNMEVTDVTTDAP